jgi:head-tail adaptor
MTGAGDLDHRVAFDARTAVDDGSGNEVSGPFTERFKRLAAFVYAGGGEAVMAARLEGRGVLKVRVRSCSLTRGISSDWRMRDVRRGTPFNIREVDAVTDRDWVYLVVESGGAS